MSSLIEQLVDKDPVRRLKNALGLSTTNDDETTLEELQTLKKKDLTYDSIRNHPFFTEWKGSGQPDDPLRSVETMNQTIFTNSIEYGNSYVARVPLLSELCIRAVGKSCIRLANDIALNGGVRPTVPWMKVSID